MQDVALVRRYAAAGWRHRWKAMLLAWLVCLVGWAGIQSLPNQYESSARIYADADAILSMLLRGIAIDSTPAGQVEVLQRTLLSRPNLEKVVARTDLNGRVDSVASRDLLLQELTRSIRITPQTRNLFTIDYRDHNARVARDVVQTTLNLFMESASTNDRQQMESAKTFVAQQIASYETQLRQAERRKAEFQARYIDLLPSDAFGGSSRLEAARTRLHQVQGELQDARMRRDLTQQQIDAVPAQFVTEGGGGGGDGRLAEAERNLRDLRLRYTELHPDVVAARRVVGELRASGGGGPSRAPAAPRAPRSNPLLEQLRVRLVDVNAQIGSLERQERDGRSEVERLDSVARSEPEVQAQYLNLDRDYSVLRRNYEELLARRESIQIAGAARTNADRVRLEVVDPPTLPTRPVAPNRPLLAAGVLAAGLGAGALLALLLVQFDRTFYTVHDLRKLGLTVLGGVSAPAEPRRIGPPLAFACAAALLFAGFGAVLAGVPGLLMRTLLA
ncbi:polysaccharide chain length determinant protein (PEP-CTERM system associated) [Humitalea rosea]|uniref:Polysaccharide chain length determinant protein (PEP-CTERM system associated) n=1 Tax=Humitalea rosea TaxID=990373 RepID=A0A2W7IIR3_9PROT|nr:XrtA system polysaccharide chain length determinant [Humitalea rosea]PZW46790.1 polysaccharide chain length determinant protein (PEP-CTERM system associated) [Humitalea rosea]